MENLILNIYDSTGKNIVKTHKSTTFDLMFGTVMSLMDLLKIEDLENTVELLKVLHNAWTEIKNVLSEVFPEITDEEWKYVKVKELLPIIIKIAKFAITDMMSIPTDSKN